MIRRGRVIWHDEPLFGAELLYGAAAMPDGHRTRIEGFLRDVAAARSAPLHPATAWNALHFGFDPDEGCYRGLPEEFVDVHASPAAGMPVGAFVQHVRSRHTLWGEVVAVFGAADGLGDEDGWIDPEAHYPTRQVPGASGRPGIPLRERVIVDWSAFVPEDGGEAAEVRRCRAGRPGSALDPLGHVCRTVVYPDPKPEPGGLALDLALYADHVLRYRHELLDLGLLAGLLDEPENDRVLREAVLASLTTVAEILEATPGLMTWAGYATPEFRFGDRMRSTGLLGGDDLRDLAHRATHAKPHEIRFTAVLPAVLNLAATRRDEAGDNVAPPPVGVEVAEALVHANLAIAQQADHARPGVGVTLRETWQAGGIWVVAPVETDAMVDDDDQFDMAQSPDNLLVSSLVLTAGQLDSGVLPLSETLSEALDERRFVLVDVHTEAGPALLPSEALQRAAVDGGTLRLDWPVCVLPGHRAVASMAPGAARVRVDLVEQRTASSTGRGAPFDDNVRGAVLATIRFSGARGSHGERSMLANQLLEAVVGDYPIVDGTVVRRSVLAACRSLVDAGLLHVSLGEPSTEAVDALVQRRGVETYTWWPSGAGPAEVVGALPPGDEALPDVKAVHTVAPFLRQLHPGWRASDEAREEYAHYARRHGLTPELPEGTTFVRRHERGGRDTEAFMEPDIRCDDRSL